MARCQSPSSPPRSPCTTGLAGDDPVTTRPLPAPLTRFGQLRQYRGVLDRQIQTAEGLLKSIVDRMVTTRAVVAGRLQELSPQLYQQGLLIIDRQPMSPEAAAAAAAAPLRAADLAAASLAEPADAAPGPLAPAPAPSSLRATWQRLLSGLLRAWARLWDMRRGRAQRVAEAIGRDRQFEDALESYKRRAEQWRR